MQNTIVKEFDGDPDVVPVIFDQGGANGETRPWLETFWTNYFLRGAVIWDEAGATGAAYGQPNTGLPFGRGFVIDRDGSVALPYFGHQPEMAIEFIRGMLAGSAVPDESRGSSGWRPDEAAARPWRPRILSVHPNPARNRVVVLAEILRAGSLRWELFDLTGRCAAAGSIGPTARGVRSWGLPLGSAEGRGLPEGRYFLRVRDEYGGASAPIVLLKGQTAAR